MRYYKLFSKPDHGIDFEREQGGTTHEKTIDGMAFDASDRTAGAADAGLGIGCA